MMRIRATCVLAAAFLAAAAGCGGGGSQGMGTPSAREKLAEVKSMLDTLAADRQKPPSKLAELGAVEPMLPIAAGDIRSGEIVYVWGTALAPGSAAVIAYEKKVPTEGGWVLLQDGTLREMTAEEYNSAPKAKK
jgi:hypothetical protein